MQYYFAPMEGLTGYVYRQAHHAVYPGLARYYTPFINYTEGRKPLTRDHNEVLPEHNAGIPVVPQVMTNRSADLVFACERLSDLGYDQVNLNLGCPSATVVSKSRGAGFLADPDALDRFFDEFFSRCSVPLSVKTRLGLKSPDEFPRLIEVFNRYPLCELILHPRVREDFYKNTPNRAVFEEALHVSRAPMCYNGDLFSVQDISSLPDSLPAAMLGRGLLAVPYLLSPETDKTPEKLRLFHEKLLSGYCEMLDGDKNVLFRMKELWSYMGCCFESPEKPLKRIRKSNRLSDYRIAVDQLFSEHRFLPDACFRGII